MFNKALQFNLIHVSSTILIHKENYDCFTVSNGKTFSNAPSLCCSTTQTSRQTEASSTKIWKAGEPHAGIFIGQPATTEFISILLPWQVWHGWKFLVNISDICVFQCIYD